MERGILLKKSTFFTGLLTLMFSTSAIAQDLTIEAADFIIEESGTLDKLTGCIQSTSETTRICLGEVDFEISMLLPVLFLPMVGAPTAGRFYMPVRIMNLRSLLLK